MTLTKICILRKAESKLIKCLGLNLGLSKSWRW